MRAIIIDDKDAVALLDKLKLANFERYGQQVRERYNIPEGAMAELRDDIHRKFHYEVTRWLQDQGANTLRF